MRVFKRKAERRKKELLMISVYITAARSPPRSEPANSPRLAPERDASQHALGRVVGDADPIIVEKQLEGVPATEHVVYRLGDIVVA
jgi:hypothetical protein